MSAPEHASPRCEVKRVRDACYNVGVNSANADICTADILNAAVRNLYKQHNPSGRPPTNVEYRSKCKNNLVLGIEVQTLPINKSKFHQMTIAWPAQYVPWLNLNKPSIMQVVSRHIRISCKIRSIVGIQWQVLRRIINDMARQIKKPSNWEEKLYRWLIKYPPAPKDSVLENGAMGDATPMNMHYT